MNETFQVDKQYIYMNKVKIIILYLFVFMNFVFSSLKNYLLVVDHCVS